MDRPNLDNITPEQARYIQDLEARIGGVPKLLQELNLVADGYAEDLIKIRTGNSGVDGVNLNYLNSDKNDGTFGKIMTLVDKSDKLVKIGLATSQAIESTKEEVAVEKPKARRNLQDLVMQDR